MSDDLEQGMPQVSGPLVDEAGIITQAWWAFFRQLWVRTGSAQGVSALDLELLGLFNGGASTNDQTARSESAAALLAAINPADMGSAARAALNEAKLFALSLFSPARPQTSVTPSTAEIWVPVVVGEPPLLVSDGCGQLIMTPWEQDPP